MFDEIKNGLTDNLVIKPKIFPNISERTFWDTVPSDGYIKCGETYLDYEWPQVTATSIFRFYKCGDRDENQRLYFGRRQALQALLLAECTENCGRFLNDIINGIIAICEESTWSVVAHFGFGKFTNVLPDTDEEIIFDIFAGETGGFLSILSHVLEQPLNKITPIIVKRIKSEVYKRIIAPFLDQDDIWWMGYDSGVQMNNWTPWCISNVLLGAAVFCDDAQDLEKIVTKAMLILERFLQRYSEDGGCDEGPHYWGRSAASVADCFDFISLLTDNKFNLYGQSLIRKMGEYIVDTRLTTYNYMNCADCPAKVAVNAARLFSFGEKVGSHRMMAEAADIYRRDGNNLYGSEKSDGRWATFRTILDLLTLKKLEEFASSDKCKLDVWYEKLHILIARESIEMDCGLVLAVKGGCNAENHNHNDLGNIMVFDEGEPVFIDLGVGNYTAKTFSKDRYDIWTMSSSYHNVPQIGEEIQMHGPKCKAEIIKYYATNEETAVSMNIASAYPQNTKTWIRTVSLNRKQSNIIIEDNYILKGHHEVIFNFISAQKPKTLPEGIVVGARTLKCISKGMIIKLEEVAVDDEFLARMVGNIVYRIVIKTKDKSTSGKIIFSLS